MRFKLAKIFWGILLLILARVSMVASAATNESAPSNAVAVPNELTQSNPAVPVSPAAQTQDLSLGGETIEQIDIIGQRSTISLQAEIHHDEVKMFSLFNELNSTDDFDVACGWATYTGSKLRHWECTAKYLRRAGMDDVQEFFNLGGFSSGRSIRNDANRAFDLQYKADQLNAEMKTLAQQHPELAKAMLELYAKKQKLTEMERQAGN